MIIREHVINLLAIQIGLDADAASCSIAFTVRVELNFATILSCYNRGHVGGFDCFQLVFESDGSGFTHRAISQLGCIVEVSLSIAVAGVIIIVLHPAHVAALLDRFGVPLPMWGIFLARLVIICS